MVDHFDQASRTLPRGVFNNALTEAELMPSLGEAADLDPAIAAALNKQTLRPYVERRAQAIGFNGEFPWR